MTKPKTELEELISLQKKSQELQGQRETSVRDATSTSREDSGKAPARNPDIKEESAAPDDQGEVVEGLTGQIENIMSELEEAAVEHPALALLAAFGIGIFVGQLLSRR